MRIIFLFYIILVFIFSNTYAQTAGTKLIRDIQYADARGKVNIVQDEDIIRLIDKHLFEEGKKKVISGYRIRLFSDSGPQARNEGRVIEARFIERYEGIQTHYFFNSPFWRLYVGDFRTKSEAIKFLRQIEGEFPDAFIIRSNINYPDL